MRFYLLKSIEYLNFRHFCEQLLIYIDIYFATICTIFIFNDLYHSQLCQLPQAIF